MLEQLNEDNSTIDHGRNQLDVPDPQNKFIDKAISRRGVITGLLGTAAGISAATTIGNRNVFAQGPTLDPDWQAMLNVAQANSRNQAVISMPEKGRIATFGDNLFHQASDNTFNFFSGAQLMFSGSSIETEVGALDQVVVGNTLTKVTTVQATNGKSLRVQSRIQVLDSFNCAFQVDVAVGPANGPATFWFTTVYNYCTGFFPAGFTVRGVVPDFDYTPVEFLGQLLTRNSTFRGMPLEEGIFVQSAPPPQGTATPKPKPKRSFFSRLVDAVLVGVVAGAFAGTGVGVVVGVVVFLLF